MISLTITADPAGGSGTYCTLRGAGSCCKARLACLTGEWLLGVEAGDCTTGDCTTGDGPIGEALLRERGVPAAPEGTDGGMDASSMGCGSDGSDGVMLIGVLEAPEETAIGSGGSGVPPSANGR